MFACFLESSIFIFGENNLGIHFQLVFLLCWFRSISLNFEILPLILSKLPPKANKLKLKFPSAASGFPKFVQLRMDI